MHIKNKKNHYSYLQPSACQLLKLTVQLPDHRPQTQLHFPKMKKKKVSCIRYLTKNQKLPYSIFFQARLTWILIIRGRGCLVFTPPSIAIPNKGFVFFTVIRKFPYWSGTICFEDENIYLFEKMFIVRGIEIISHVRVMEGYIKKKQKQLKQKSNLYPLIILLVRT